MTAPTVIEWVHINIHRITIPEVSFHHLQERIPAEFGQVEDILSLRAVHASLLPSH